MPESWDTRVKRWGFNWFPAYRSTGARIEYIAADWQEVRIRLPLNWHTRNYVGTIFGGSMYASVDPIYMVMLIKLLGPGYEVWDKAATMRFRQPGRSKLHATFTISTGELEEIRTAVSKSGRMERRFTIDLLDDDNQTCFSCEKTLSIRKRADITA